ncbi:MAG: FkbM family methyltransferase [Woeseiaceae bacterium]
MANEKLEKFVRDTANSLGLDITRYRPERTEVGRLTSMLNHHEVNCVLDIGANSGQFATALRKTGYKRRIISFEPLSAAYAALIQASSPDVLWDVAPRVAVGDSAGEIDIHIAGNSVSSSLLKMLDSHVAAAPTSAYIGTERTDVRTLDDLAAQLVAADARSFLKIDTQGYEAQVLNGASETLNKVLGVQLELSLVPLYEQQVMYDELVERIRALGFEIWAIWPALFDPGTGRMVQADATFFRV